MKTIESFLNIYVIVYIEYIELSKHIFILIKYMIIMLTQLSSTNADWADVSENFHTVHGVLKAKNTEVVCHSLLQRTTFCQTSPPWPTHCGWPHTAWLSFIELDKSVVSVIRLTSFLWLWFVCLPSDVSPNTYCLTSVSLTLDVGYLFMTAAWISKCSCWF